eukprot:TRINITY_DN5142_c0_g1_i6.p2 TRINITY_DN5142_c0_g1~~TRINITY_DN5142_c0_g1_i6.p2  ORF type:complete len:523 (-),score=35.28 TRINITY_DN5142_c0_g1_i6:378-1832(-)
MTSQSRDKLDNFQTNAVPSQPERNRLGREFLEVGNTGRVKQLIQFYTGWSKVTQESTTVESKKPRLQKKLDEQQCRSVYSINISSNVVNVQNNLQQREINEPTESSVYSNKQEGKKEQQKQLQRLDYNIVNNQQMQQQLLEFDVNSKHSQNAQQQLSQFEGSNEENQNYQYRQKYTWKEIQHALDGVSLLVNSYDDAKLSKRFLSVIKNYNYFDSCQQCQKLDSQQITQQYIGQVNGNFNNSDSVDRSRQLQQLNSYGIFRQFQQRQEQMTEYFIRDQEENELMMEKQNCQQFDVNQVGNLSKKEFVEDNFRNDNNNFTNQKSSVVNNIAYCKRNNNDNLKKNNWICWKRNYDSIINNSSENNCEKRKKLCCWNTTFKTNTGSGEMKSFQSSPRFLRNSSLEANKVQGKQSEKKALGLHQKQYYKQYYCGVKRNKKFEASNSKIALGIYDRKIVRSRKELSRMELERLKTKFVELEMVVAQVLK